MSILNCLAALFLMCIALRVDRPRLRQVLMLGASYSFYLAWGVLFFVILLGSSAFNFAIGKLLQRRRTAGILWFGIVVNVVLLGFFKYIPALLPKLSIAGLGPILMPVGISFWTFQAVSYLVDLYREEDIDPSLLEFCLYMSFWPTVVMGPVCRLYKMLPQFRQPEEPSRANLFYGLRRIFTGLFMKLIVAQLLGASFGMSSVVSDGTLPQWSGVDVWFIAIGFGFQLFFDFAGYSNIVIGAARLFGIVLEENFDAPFFATTPSLFWTKWHMSLSSWIRDYVFMPVATLRRDMWWRYCALIFSMVLFGLWHGATICFVLWGLYQGLFLVMHRLVQKQQLRLSVVPEAVENILAWLVTFLGISLSWVLFRTSDLAEAMRMFKAILSPNGYFQIHLSPDYCRLVTVVAVGYLVVVGLARKGSSSVRLHRVDTTEMSGVFDGALVVLWENRLWWVAPMIATLVVFAGAAVFVESTRVTSFIYTLF